MGMVGRLSHHALVSRRRTHRRRPHARRLHHWPDAMAKASAPMSSHGAQGEALVPDSVFSASLLRPLSRLPLAAGMGLSRTAGLVDVAEVIESEPSQGSAEAANEAQRQPSALDMPLAHLGWGAPFHWLALGWRDFMRSPLIGLFYGACFVMMGWALLGVF